MTQLMPSIFVCDRHEDAHFEIPIDPRIALEIHYFPFLSPSSAGSIIRTAGSPLTSNREEHRDEKARRDRPGH